MVVEPPRPEQVARRGLIDAPPAEAARLQVDPDDHAPR